jgi:glycosyltransferase involved in cell wall biosynthesis
MKILFIAPEPPTPYGGGSQRMYYMLKYLASLGAVIDLLVPVTERNRGQLELTKGFCRRVFSVLVRPMLAERIVKAVFLKAYPFHAAFKKELDRVIAQEEYDLVHVEKFQMAGYAVGIGRCPVMVDLWACGFDGPIYELRQAPGVIDRLVILQRLLRYIIADRRLYGKFKYFMTVSDKARDYILTHYPDKKVFIVSQGIEPGLEKGPAAENPSMEKRLIFTGDMSFSPNIDAVRYFTDQIYPRIKREVPDVTFYIVGTKPAREVVALGARDPSITVTGHVDDIGEYLKKARVSVVPLLGGSGIRTKILEAFYHGKAVVSTQNALEGISAVCGKEVLVADSPEAFAKDVVRLLNDEQLRRELAHNAFSLVTSRYAWQKIAADMMDCYNQIIKWKSHGTALK